MFLRLIDRQVPQGTVLSVQMRVLCESGGSGLLQYSQLGLSSSMRLFFVADHG